MSSKRKIDTLAEINTREPLARIPGEPVKSVELLREYADMGVMRKTSLLASRYDVAADVVARYRREYSWDDRVAMWSIEQGRRADLQMQELRRTAALDVLMQVRKVREEAMAEWERQLEAGSKSRNSDLLRIILTALADERKQLGLDAPSKLAITASVDDRVEEMIAARFAKAAELIGDPKIIDALERAFCGEVVDVDFVETTNQLPSPPADREKEK